MSEEEEAELLARALESDERPSAIADVLETADAVRMRRVALLEKERAQAVLDVVERRLARARKRKWFFAGGGGALAAAAAAMLVLVELRSSESAPVASAPSAPEAAKTAEATAGSAPSIEAMRRALFESQLAYVEQGRADDLDLRLGQYRDAYLASLEAKYP